MQHTRPPVIFAPTPTALITLHSVSYDGRQRSPRRYLNLTFCWLMLNSYLSCLKKIHEIFCFGLQTRETQNNTLFYEHTDPALKLKNITCCVLSFRSSSMQRHPIYFKEWSIRTQSLAYYFVIKNTCKQRTEPLRPLNSDLECTLSMT